MRYLLCVLLALAASAASAVVVPGLSVRKLIDDADVIAVGTIVRIEHVGDTVIHQTSGTTVPAEQMVASMSVNQILKGSTPDSVLDVRFEKPETFIGYMSVISGDFVIAFLRRQGSEYEFVDPFNPTFPAELGAQGHGDDATERVMTLLADGLRRSTGPSLTMTTFFELRWASRQLEDFDFSTVIEAVRPYLNDSGRAVRLSAIRTLLDFNQDDVLPLAADALEQAGAPEFAPDIYLDNIRPGIRNGVFTETAIPTLERLMHFPDAETRRAAARALWNMGTSSVIPLLASALDDEDFEVRFTAVAALSRMSGRQDLVPGYDGFRQNEPKYIVPLRSWALEASR